MKYLIEVNNRLFIETGNPIYAWKCIEHALFLGAPVPCGVIGYLRDTAHELIKVAQNPPKPAQRPVAISKALKLHKDGAGQGSPFASYGERQHKREIALATAERLEFYGPGKDDYAFEDVAEKYGVSKSTVRRNYLEHLGRWKGIARTLINSGQIKFNAGGEPQTQANGTAQDIREAAEILKEAKRQKEQT